MKDKSVRVTGISWKKALARYWELYLIFLPVAMWYIIFHYVPMGGIIVAFKQYRVLQGIFASPWVGLANFRTFMSSPAFISTLRNTVLISSYNLIFGFPVPIIFALLLNEVPHKLFKRSVQTVSYLPHFVSWAIAGGLFYMLFSLNSGPVNGIIRALGLESINFLGNPATFRPLVVISGIWKSMGWGAIVYIAAIAGVDAEMYEAAYIDGANRFHRIFYITLPTISNVISIMLILQVGNILTINFEQIFVLINDVVLGVGETIDYYIYRVGMYSPNNYSLGAAVGLFKSIIGLALVLFTNWLSKKITDGGGVW